MDDAPEAHIEAAADAAYMLADRAHERQSQLVVHEDDKVEQFLRLAMAVIAGQVVVAGMLQAGPGLDATAVSILGVAMVFSLSGVFGLFWATVFAIGTSYVSVGLDARDLRDATSQPDVRRRAILVTAILGLVDAQEHNERLLQASLRARAFAGVAVGTGLAMHLCALAYILRRFIFA